MRGELVSENELKLYETITKGSDVCANGQFSYELQDGIINQANYYRLENDKHKVEIDQYHFEADSFEWNNEIIHQSIANTRYEIRQFEKEIVKLETLIKESENNITQSKRYLETNATFNNGKCAKPELAPEPFPLYDTEEKASHYALAYCSVSFGCRVGVELAREKLNTGMKRFLASQTCSLMVLDYRANNTVLDETMFNLLDAVSYSGCSGESDDPFSALFQAGSCMMSGAIKVARVGQYMDCIAYKTDEFYNYYLDWKNAPEKAKILCENNINTIEKTPQKIVYYKGNITKFKKKIALKEKALNAILDELKNAKNLRENQSQLLKKLRR